MAKLTLHLTRKVISKVVSTRNFISW